MSSVKILYNIAVFLISVMCMCVSMCSYEGRSPKEARMRIDRFHAHRLTRALQDLHQASWHQGSYRTRKAKPITVSSAPSFLSTKVLRPSCRKSEGI